MFLDGAQIIVDYECERILPGWIPRRFGECKLHCKLHPLMIDMYMCTGGGLGGKKESGQLRFGGRERSFKKPMYVMLQYTTIARHILF